jgi:uncharacterized phage infection (PIP) family protein YhgE
MFIEYLCKKYDVTEHHSLADLLRTFVSQIIAHQEGLAKMTTELEQLQTDVGTLQTKMTSLQGDVSTLQNNYGTLSTLLNTKVVPDIQSAIALINEGNIDGALSALDATVQAITRTTAETDTSVQSVGTQVEADTTAAQTADTALEGAEGSGSGSAPAPASSSTTEAPPSSGPLQPGGPGTPLVHQ